MSPEVLRGEGHHFSSDIWSLGCMLYELATLRSPFHEKGLTMDRLFGKIVKGEFWRPGLSVPYTGRVSRVVESMLAVDPKNRPDITWCADTALLARRASEQAVANGQQRQRMDSSPHPLRGQCGPVSESVATSAHFPAPLGAVPPPPLYFQGGVDAEQKPTISQGNIGISPQHCGDGAEDASPSSPFARDVLSTNETDQGQCGPMRLVSTGFNGCVARQPWLGATGPTFHTGALETRESGSVEPECSLGSELSNRLPSRGVGNGSIATMGRINEELSPTAEVSVSPSQASLCSSRSTSRVFEDVYDEEELILMNELVAGESTDDVGPFSSSSGAGSHRRESSGTDDRVVAASGSSQHMPPQRSPPPPGTPSNPTRPRSAPHAVHPQPFEECLACESVDSGTQHQRSVPSNSPSPAGRSVISFGSALVSGLVPRRRSNGKVYVGDFDLPMQPEK
jgi:serine/threonine protein kinase